MSGASTETGRIRDIHIKSDFGFVLFEDDRDADDAVYYLHGYELDGKRLIVEHQRGKGALGSLLAIGVSCLFAFGLPFFCRVTESQGVAFPAVNCVPNLTVSPHSAPLCAETPTCHTLYILFRSYRMI